MLLTDELLLNYKRCQRRTFLDIYGNASDRNREKDFLIKLRRENHNHVDRVLTRLNLDCSKTQSAYQDWQIKAQETENLMQQGVDCIYEGVLTLEWQPHHLASNLNGDRIVLIGNPHLLIKQPGHSKFGDWSYFPVSIKLGRRPKTEYKLIAAFYAQLLTHIQEASPGISQLILKDYQTYKINLEQWIPKAQQLIIDCLKTLADTQAPEVFISRQRCNLCHWNAHCYEDAKAKQHLSLVPGITPNRYEYLQAKGILSIESLAAASALELGDEIGFEIASDITQQAQSLLGNQALIKWNYDPSLDLLVENNSCELYFDIEAEPERNLDYLLGVLVVDRVKGQEQFYSLIAEKPEDEGKIWQDFIDLVSLYDRAPIFHFSDYEIDTMQRLAVLYKTPDNFVSSLLSRCVDLHRLVTNSVTVPVESYSLKSLANWLGFQWRDRSANGEQSVCWYDLWLQTGDRDLLNSILRYNEDDCRATFHLKEWLTQFLMANGNRD
jgi:uncharacterized protein